MHFRCCNKKKWIGCLLCIVFTLLCLTTVPVKKAVDIDIAEDNQTIDIDSMLGCNVTLLCEHSDKEVTEPEDYNFIVLAALNQTGSFTPIFDSQKATLRCKGIYIYPKSFIGGAVREYNWGNRNVFVFNGVLENATATDGVDFEDAYRLVLSSWEIAYPVYLWEGYLHPDVDFYKRNLFILDYLIP